MPMQCFVSCVLPVLIVALYTMSLLMHLFCSGHACLFLQLQFSAVISNTLKERYRNHIKSFTHKKYSNETELSKHVCHLKQNKTDFTIKWSIVKKSISYTGESKRCNLCLDEKITILKEKNNCLLNKRSEIVSAYQPKSRFQVNNLNKERNACYSTTHAPTFPP